VQGKPSHHQGRLDLAQAPRSKPSGQPKTTVPPQIKDLSDRGRWSERSTVGPRQCVERRSAQDHPKAVDRTCRGEHVAAALRRQVLAHRPFARHQAPPAHATPVLPNTGAERTTDAHVLVGFVFAVPPSPAEAEGGSLHGPGTVRLCCDHAISAHTSRPLGPPIQPVRTDKA
jgi:hypothetical protein